MFNTLQFIATGTPHPDPAAYDTFASHVSQTFMHSYQKQITLNQQKSRAQFFINELNGPYYILQAVQRINEPFSSVCGQKLLASAFSSNHQILRENQSIKSGLKFTLSLVLNQHESIAFSIIEESLNTLRVAILMQDEDVMEKKIKTSEKILSEFDVLHSALQNLKKTSVTVRRAASETAAASLLSIYRSLALKKNLCNDSKLLSFLNNTENILIIGQCLTTNHKHDSLVHNVLKDFEIVEKALNELKQENSSLNQIAIDTLATLLPFYYQYRTSYNENDTTNNFDENENLKYIYSQLSNLLLISSSSLNNHSTDSIINSNQSSLNGKKTIIWRRIVDLLSIQSIPSNIETKSMIIEALFSCLQNLTSNSEIHQLAVLKALIASTRNVSRQNIDQEEKLDRYQKVQNKSHQIFRHSLSGVSFCNPLSSAVAQQSAQLILQLESSFKSNSIEDLIVTLFNSAIESSSCSVIEGILSSAISLTIDQSIRDSYYNAVVSIIMKTLEMFSLEIQETALHVISLPNVNIEILKRLNDHGAIHHAWYAATQHNGDDSDFQISGLEALRELIQAEIQEKQIISKKDLHRILQIVLKTKDTDIQVAALRTACYWLSNDLLLSSLSSIHFSNDSNLDHFKTNNLLNGNNGINFNDLMSQICIQSYEDCIGIEEQRLVMKLFVKFVTHRLIFQHNEKDIMESPVSSCLCYNMAKYKMSCIRFFDAFIDNDEEEGKKIVNLIRKNCFDEKNQNHIHQKYNNNNNNNNNNNSNNNNSINEESELLFQFVFNRIQSQLNQHEQLNDDMMDIYDDEWLNHLFEGDLECYC